MAKITDSLRLAALRRGIAIRPHQLKGTVDQRATLAAVVELANGGFLVSPEDLKGLPISYLEQLIGDVRTLVGADRTWTPIYPGFPKQVEELDTLTLLVEQILHYWTGGAFLPNHPTVAREGLPLADMLRGARELKVQEAGPAARLLLGQLLASPVALSEEENKLLIACVELFPQDQTAVTEALKIIVHGEILQIYLQAVKVFSGLSAEKLFAVAAPAARSLDHLLRSYLVLFGAASAEKHQENFERAVYHLSDKDAPALRLKSVSKASRRLLIARLADLSVGYKADALVGKQQLWQRVMRSVHPYSLSGAAAAKRPLDVIHSNGVYKTLNSTVEALLEAKDAAGVITLLSAERPRDLLQRLVELLRMVKTQAEADQLATAVLKATRRSTVGDLISAYNGVLVTNDSHARLTRVAGRQNTLVEREFEKVSEDYLRTVREALLQQLETVLKSAPAPTGVVGTLGATAVPLVRRDLSTSDRIMDRGASMGLVGEGNILRIFGHWNNNMGRSGYMDIGAVVLDKDMNHLAVTTWDTWDSHRDWSTYSGDCLVSPGGSAAEYFDLKLDKLKKAHPTAKWVAMTVQSWSGFPMAEVDFIAGAMLRSVAEKGEVFDPRTLATSFKPTTTATQAVPLAVNLEEGAMYWLDTSNGSTESSVSSSRDETIGTLVYDELERPRLTMGELATLWAKAHGATTDASAEVDRDAVLALL